MENHQPRPMAVFLKLHAIYRAICTGNALLTDIANATGLPATTIVRVATLMVEDEMIDWEISGGDLYLTMRIRLDPASFN